MEKTPELDRVAALIARDFEVLQKHRPETERTWALGGPSALVAYRPDVNGMAQVDVVSRPWSDDMGHPREAPELFSAWALGNFGPTAFPGALRRAIDHSWNWPEGRHLAPRHTAFLRVRLSYVLGLTSDAVVRPDDADVLDELRFVSQLQLALMSLPGALAAFNPNGELLLSKDSLHEPLARDFGGGAIAIDAWCNVRRFRPEEAEGWLLYDTVGMGQLDVADHEGSLPEDHGSKGELYGLLCSIAEYDASKGGVLGVGDTSSDLAGQDWVALAAGDGLFGPPREVLRWAPEGLNPPTSLQKPREGEA
jgi:hypothetical protein